MTAEIDNNMSRKHFISLFSRSVGIVLISQIVPSRLQDVLLANGISKEDIQISIVLDDAGNSINAYRNLQRLKELNIPLTIAILPKSKYALKSLDEMISYSNADIFLHQPMEPQGLYIRKGLSGGLEDITRKPGEKYDSSIHTAIYSWDASSTATEILNNNIREMNDYLITKNSPKMVIGFNNHMGSEATKNRTLMNAAANLANDLGLYVLDSRTTPDSVLFDAAYEVNSSTAFKREGKFLDNDVHKERPLKIIEETKKNVNDYKRCILIGHLSNNTTTDDIISYYKMNNALYRLSKF